MKRCPLCETDNDSTALLCSCGYNFESREISDSQSENVRKWINAGLEWYDKVERITRVHKIQVEKHGEKISTRQDAEGWSKRDTAKLLDKDIFRHLEVGGAIKDNPSLLKCKNLKQAYDHLKKLQKGSTFNKDSLGFESEELLQRYLESNWENSVLAKDWKLIKRGKYDTREIGEIDLLAYHKRESWWLVIELKKEQSSDKTIGQILRYMGWVKHERAKENEKVKGLIISKSVDEQILYSMLCTTNIDLMRYDLADNELKLTRVTPNNAELLFVKYGTSISLEKRKQLIERLEKESVDCIKT